MKDWLDRYPEAQYVDDDPHSNCLVCDEAKGIPCRDRAKGLVRDVLSELDVDDSWKRNVADFIEERGMWFQSVEDVADEVRLEYGDYPTRKATCLGKAEGTWRGNARLYQLSPPIWADLDGQASPQKAEFVVVSTVGLWNGTVETMMFGWDTKMKATTWIGRSEENSEHDELLLSVGYELE